MVYKFYIYFSCFQFQGKIYRILEGLTHIRVVKEVVPTSGTRVATPNLKGINQRPGTRFALDLLFEGPHPPFLCPLLQRTFFLYIDALQTCGDIVSPLLRRQ